MRKITEKIKENKRPTKKQIKDLNEVINNLRVRNNTLTDEFDRINSDKRYWSNKYTDLVSVYNHQQDKVHKLQDQSFILWLGQIVFYLVCFIMMMHDMTTRCGIEWVFIYVPFLICGFFWSFYWFLNHE